MLLIKVVIKQLFKSGIILFLFFLFIYFGLKIITNHNDHEIVKSVGLPCFVKANRSGSSFGIYKVYKKTELAISIKKAFKEDSQLIIEKALKGREFSVGVYKLNNEIKQVKNNIFT